MADAVRTLATLLTAASLALANSAVAQTVDPVRGFEPARYLGTWHQVAAIPAWFQDQCAYAVTATYNRDEEPGRLRVLNACRTADGTLDQAIGRARFTEGPDVAALEVTFVKFLGAWRWFAGGDYVVIALDEDYRWSAVAHPSRDFAWILAREPELDPATLAEIEAAYEAAGYDTCRLLRTPREAGGAETPLCEWAASAP
ncbi:MAG: lipocalin family protein [Alphaproteobacteria bacterium]